VHLLDLLFSIVTIKTIVSVAGSMNSNAMITINAVKEVVSPGTGVGKGCVDNVTESEITLTVSLKRFIRKSSCFEES